VHVALIYALCVAIPGIMLHTVVYGWLRGKFSYTRANALQVVNLAVVYLAAFAIPGLDAAAVVTVQGAACSLIACAFVWPDLRSVALRAHTRSELLQRGLELVRYGVVRIPGEVALGLLFALPVVVTAHYRGVEEAGFVGLGVSLATMIGAVIAPLGRILLPTASAMAASGNLGLLRRETMRLLMICVAVAVAGVAVVGLLAPWLIDLFFGERFKPATPYVRVVLLSAVPYVLYVVFRSILDALHVRAFNSKNLLVALGIFSLIAFLGQGAGMSVPFAFVSGILALGLLSAYDGLRLLRT
jgi:O-antigen/teichoic acid export membrane protein